MAFLTIATVTYPVLTDGASEGEPAFGGLLWEVAWDGTAQVTSAPERRSRQFTLAPMTEAQEQTLRTLRSWVQLRDHYVARRREDETFIASLAETALRRIAQAESRHLERLIEKLDEKIQRFLDEQAPALNDAVQTLCLVSGVAWRSATGLLAYLPEMGRCSGQQIAKLAGLAPLADDSGPRNGPRHIARGRAPARRVLYMIALVAARYNEHSRRFYLRLRAAGKPPKVALIAVARKLLVFLNSLLKPAYSTA